MGFEFTPQRAVIIALCAFGLYGAFRFFRKRQAAKSDTVNWTPLEAVGVTIAIYFVSQLVVALAVGWFGGLAGMSDEQLNKALDSNVAQFGFILTVEALSIALLYEFMKIRKTPWRAIGLVKPRIKDIFYALAGFGVYFVVYAFIVATLVEKYLTRIDTEQKQQLGFDTATVGPELILVFVSLVILPPLVEEILVRGFLFTGLKNKLPLFVAAIITSVIFAAAHLQWGSDAPLLWTAAIDTFVLSMILVYVRQRSGSLWPGIGIHFIKNGLAFLYLFILKIV